MLITVAIPVYNGEKSIRRCIESALNQDYKEDYEVLVINNASTDKTLEIVQSFNDKRIRIVNNHETLSMWKNHNKCFEEAKGDYVFIVHADDMATPEALKIITSRLAERLYPKKYIMWGHSMFADATDWVMRMANIPMLGYNMMFSGETALRIFLTCATTQPTGAVFSRESTLAIGGYLDVDVPAPEESILTLRAVFAHFEFEMIDRLLFIREFSSTQSKVTPAEERRSLVLSMEAFWNEIDDQKRGLIRRVCVMYDIPTWDKMLKINIRKEQRNYAIRQIIKRPWSLQRWSNLFTKLAKYSNYPIDYRLKEGCNYKV